MKYALSLSHASKTYLTNGNGNQAVIDLTTLGDRSAAWALQGTSKSSPKLLTGKRKDGSKFEAVIRTAGQIHRDGCADFDKLMEELRKDGVKGILVTDVKVETAEAAQAVEEAFIDLV